MTELITIGDLREPHLDDAQLAALEYGRTLDVVFDEEDHLLSDDQGKFMNRSRVSKQILPYIFR